MVADTPPDADSSLRALYVLDDNAEFRTSIKWWLSGAGYAVFDFDDANNAIEALKALDLQERRRSCLLLDVRMPTMSGLQVHEAQIHCGVTGAGTRFPLPIIYMTGHGDVPLAVQAMEKGAVTFLEKPFEDSALESALARAFDSHAAMLAASAPGRQASHPELQARLQTLTAREREIMQAVTNGKTSKMIARELDISIKTVDLHRARILAKMQAESALHLTRILLG